MIPAYNGSEPYIFVSYAHKDSEAVYRTIEKLTSLGYRIWYDEGIKPGVEWPENIAIHLDQCSFLRQTVTLYQHGIPLSLHLHYLTSFSQK